MRKLIFIIVLFFSNSVYSIKIDNAFEVWSPPTNRSTDFTVKIVGPLSNMKIDETWKIVGGCSNKPNKKLKIIWPPSNMKSDITVKVVGSLSNFNVDRIVCITNVNFLKQIDKKKLQLIY